MKPRLLQLEQELYLYDDENGSSCYLLKGNGEALLIDTGFGDAGELYRALAPLAAPPWDLVITHAHGDHYANALEPGLFRSRYMHPADTAILPEMNRLFAPELHGGGLPPGRVRPIEEGDTLRCGDMRLEVIHLPGHTPGSICLLERARGWLFTGDAVGSGGQLWMQLPHGLPIARYCAHLRGFLDRMRPLGRLRFLGGHYFQAGEPGEPGYRPVTLETVGEVLRVCDCLAGEGEISVSLPDTPYPERFGGGEARIAAVGDVRLVYLPDRIH